MPTNISNKKTKTISEITSLGVIDRLLLNQPGAKQGSEWPIIYGEEKGFDRFSIEKWLDLLDTKEFTVKDIAGLYYLEVKTVLHAVACCYFDVGEVEKAEALLVEYLKNNDDSVIHNLYLRCLLAMPQTTQEFYRTQSIKWSEKYALEFNGEKNFSHIKRDPDRQLSIGILCGYAYTTLFEVAFSPLFKAIDQSKFRLVLFNMGSINNSDQMDYFDACIDMPIYHPVSLQQAVTDNHIDILIDLNGRFRLDNPIEVLMQRAAPVQISYGNMLATYGLEAIPYIMTDKYTLPVEEEKHYSEKVYRFKTHAMGTFGLPEDEISQLPCLTDQNKTFTFGSFNASFKLNQWVLETWAKILQQVPNSKLFIKAGGLESQRLHQRLVAIVDTFDLEGRITIEGFTPMDDMLKKYHKIDLALNTFPYTGGTTTAYALWQGVPSITLEREDYIQSGGGASVLKETDLDQFVTNSVEKYISKAVYFANHPQRLQKIRQSMRKRLNKSARFNPPLFAKDFEKGLRFIWQDWVKNATK
ncbi:MAG: hypothetical protein Q9M92_10860 [Enterobacterales bacterium]|nr:hypothetical protein [Enterobacterales bacterium]